MLQHRGGLPDRHYLQQVPARQRGLRLQVLQGRLALLDALVNLPGRDRFRSDFAALMLFADLLPVRHLSQLIDGKLAEQEAALAELTAFRDSGAGLPQAFVAGLATAGTLTYARSTSERRKKERSPRLRAAMNLRQEDDPRR